jgi:hypothetical protein
MDRDREDHSREEEETDAEEGDTQVRPFLGCLPHTLTHARSRTLQVTCKVDHSSVLCDVLWRYRHIASNVAQRTPMTNQRASSREVTGGKKVMLDDSENEKDEGHGLVQETLRVLEACPRSGRRISRSCVCVCVCVCVCGWGWGWTASSSHPSCDSLSRQQTTQTNNILSLTLSHTLKRTQLHTWTRQHTIM